jgi:hypothetical protein
MGNVFLLTVIVPSVLMLSVVLLSVIVLNVFMLSVVLLSVILLNVMAPEFEAIDRLETLDVFYDLLCPLITPTRNLMVMTKLGQSHKSFFCGDS